MAPKWTSKTGLASAAALCLAVGGLVAFLVGERAGRAPPAAASPPAGRATEQRPGARSYPSPLLTTEVPYRGYTVGVSGAAAGDGDPGGPAAGPEGDAARELSTAMAKLVSDLEWNSNRGLPEPPQQVVAPMPEPWRPPPDAGTQPDPLIEQVAPVRGPTRGGTQVTLRGKHLRASQVMFGASPASIVKSSEREVTVVAPPSPAGPVSIALTNADGSFAVAGTAFTYAD